MKKIFTALLCFAFFIINGAVFSQTLDSAFFLQRAEEYKNQNDLGKALDMYNTVLLKDPDNIQALNGRGVIYQRRGEYYKAKSDFERAFSINPDIAESRHNLFSINEKIRSSFGFPLNLMADDYKDAPRLLGTSEYTVVGPVYNSSGDTVPLYDRVVEKEPSQSLYERNTAGKPNTVHRNDIPEAGTSTVYKYIDLYDAEDEEEDYDVEYTVIDKPQRRVSPRTSPNNAHDSGGSMEERLPRAAVPLVTLPPPASGYLPPESQGNDDWYYEDPEYTMPAAPAPKNNPVQRFYAEQEPRTREPVKSALERRRVTPSVAEQPPASARIETPLDNKSFGSDLKSVRLEPDFDKNSVSSRSSYEKAILIYTDVITRNPNVAIAFNNRGVAYAKLGNYTKAIEDFNYALRLNPYYYDAYANCKQVKFTLAIK